MSSNAGNGAQIVPLKSGSSYRDSGQDGDLFEARVAKEAGSWQRVFTTEKVHPFDQVKWKVTDASIVGPKGNVVFELKGVEVPEWWSQNTINIVADKYMRVINGVRETSVKQVFTRVTAVIRRWAEEQNFFNSERDAQVFEEELLYALIHQYGAFNSPVWFNLGVPNRKQAASACFISSVEDTVEGIFELQHAEATIFRGGSGSGANLSDLRSSYEKISAGSYTCGPTMWMSGLNAYAGAFRSGGATRNAAKMVVLDMDHPDILETKDGRPGFIRCKAVEEKLAHDLVKLGYSVDYDDPNGAYKRVNFQNANHSVSVPDAFMQAVLDDAVWQTKERKTGKVVHEYKARDLWSEIARAAWICGDPGIQYTDTINKWHTTPKNGRIKSSNPCSEFLHVDDTACNLCAVNLTKFYEGREFLPDRFHQATRLFATAQMAMVDKADYPTKKIHENSLKLRPIGTNYGDLGALLMRLGYGYDSDEGRAVAARMASLMTGTVYLVAAKLAARAGSFPDFEKNREDMLRVMRMHQEADAKILERWHLDKAPTGDDVVSRSADVWKEAIRLGEKFGYYVSQATLQAPLGTISFLMGMDTTGIEPMFSLVSYKSLVGGGYMKLVNGAVRASIENLGYAPDAVDAICKWVEDKGCVEGAPHVNPQHVPVFDAAMPAGPSNRCLSPLAHIKMMSAIQPLITCAQSKTVNLSSTVTPDEIAAIYMESWRLGLKCVALYRDGCKASQPLSAKEDAGSRPAPAEAIPPPPPLPAPEPSQSRIRQDGPGARREKMPSDVVGWRHKFEIDGYKGYLVVDEYPDGRPGEIFLKLGKPGSTVSGLIDGFTQLCSIGLQYGIPLPKLISSFIDTRFEPAGMTNNRRVRFAKSLYDYLFRVLDDRYYGGQYSGMQERLKAMDTEAVQEGISKTEPDSDHCISVHPPEPEADAQPRRSLDAPPCQRCGGITQRNGSCYLCPSCGTSSGCS